MNLSLPALLNERHKEEEAFKKALREDALSHISTSDNYIENFSYVATCHRFHWFKNVHDGKALKCKK